VTFELKRYLVPALIMAAIYIAFLLFTKTVESLQARYKAIQRNVALPVGVQAYDKAKWHDEAVRDANLPQDRTFNHTTFFLSWLVLNGFISQSLEKSRAKQFAAFRARQASINDIYAGLDACFTSDMLTDEGNSFTRHYFDFQSGAWMADLESTLPGASEYRVDYTSENEALIHSVISQRFNEWRHAHREPPNNSFKPNPLRGSA
jgi:hypothetical protein